MTLSSLPVLYIVQCTFLLLAVRQVRVSYAAPVFLVGLITVWGVVSIYLAVAGVYLHDTFLALYPGLWLPLVPLLLVALALSAKSIRHKLHSLAMRVPMTWFAGIQILRIAAIGTLYKTLKGEFPVHIELAIGIADLLFGLSAVLIFYLCKNKKISNDALMLWHVMGVIIVAIPGVFAIQAGLPGPMQVFRDPPTAEIMLKYPMVLGPSLVVPVFFLFNMLGAWAAYIQRENK